MCDSWKGKGYKNSNQLLPLLHVASNIEKKNSIPLYKLHVLDLKFGLCLGRQEALHIAILELVEVLLLQCDQFDWDIPLLRVHSIHWLLDHLGSG